MTKDQLKGIIDSLREYEKRLHRAHDRIDAQIAKTKQIIQQVEESVAANWLPAERKDG